MHYLGIDYGKTKIGLALSEGEMASAWKVIRIAGLVDALVKISRIIKDENIEAVVIGKPEGGESLKMMSNFIQKLKNQSNVKIFEVPETLSTQDARRMMVEIGLPREKRVEDDAYSASIILQDFLDGQKMA